MYTSTQVAHYIHCTSIFKLSLFLFSFSLEDVGLSLLQHLSDLAEVAAANTHRCPDLHWVLGDHLLPLVVQHISDTEFKFQRAAEKALLVLMGKKLLNKAQVEIHVCPTVLAVASQLPLLTLRVSTASL